jgi:hypothetical protein
MLLAATLGAASAAVLIVHSNICEMVGLAPAALAWLSLIATQGAIAGFGLLDALAGYRSAFKTFDGIVFVAVFLGLLLGAFVAEPALFHLHVNWFLTDYKTRVTMVSFLVGFSGLGAAAGLWSVARGAETSMERRHAAREKRPTDLATDSNEMELEDEGRFFVLRARLGSYVSFLGLQIGAGVLSTGMLRHTLLDGGWANEGTFPPELVLAYGAYFTVLVGIVYFLASSRLNELATHLVVEVIPGKDADPVDRIKARTQMAKALGLDGGIAKQFKAAVAILTPLLSALVSIAIPHG